ncbi:MAG: hypothetical protein HRT58_22405 [Crocinitomicaceae bacterium]|nr:hypothetical protein [Flavobacteriales bacterium]NQZ38430.1 hypothetical protein [Crocinitomicaceae bacterium]
MNLIMGINYIIWMLIISMGVSYSYSQDCENSDFQSVAYFANTVALVEVDSYVEFEVVKEDLIPIAMDVTVIELINGIESRQKLTVFGFSGLQNDRELISKFHPGKRYILALHEGRELNIEGVISETYNDYYISNCGESYIENLDYLDDVHGLFPINLSNMANLYSDYIIKNLGHQVFLCDSLFNWFALNMENSTLKKIGNFPDRKTIYRRGHFFCISKDYDDLDQFYPDPLIDSKFEPIDLPNGVNYKSLVMGYLIVVDYTKRHSGVWSEAIYDPVSKEYLSGWFQSIEVESIDENIDFVLISSDGKKEILSLEFN